VNDLQSVERVGNNRGPHPPVEAPARCVEADTPDVNPDLADIPILTSLLVGEELAKLRHERDRLEWAFLEAAQVQRKFSGPRQLRRGRFEIAGEIFPLRHVSGDFLSCFDVDVHTILGVGDIAGKGLSAGMWFAHLVGLVRMLGTSLRDPAKVAASINGHLASLGPDVPFTTLFLSRIDPERSELTYCNAGHPAPLLLHREGRVEWLMEGGSVLGAIPDSAYVNGKIILDPGDTLLSYSDGILECLNACGEEFGMDRLVDAARSSSSASANALLFSVLAAVRDFAAGEPRADDLALLVVRHLSTA
jgi:serine phosphatase RsbU (regulator of sigma subunit)